MEFKDIQKVNKTLKTTPIKGKQYIEVNQRIRAFRELCPNGSIETNIESLDGGMVVMSCTIKDENGNVLAKAHAYEKEGASNINRTSYIENCCTSATGRALAYCGIGIDMSVASYEEVANAIEQQEGLELASDRDKKNFMAYCKRLNVDFAQIRKQAGQTDPKAPMTVEEHGKCLIILKDIEDSNEV